VLETIGCSGRRDLDAGAGPRPVRVGYLPNLTHAAALLGLDEDRFQGALGPGARVEPKEFVAGTEMVTAMAAGELDLAYMGPGPAIKAFTQGVPIRLLAGAASGGTVLLTRPGLAVRSVRELAGRRVTVPRYGNTQDVIVRGFLERGGLRDTAHGGSVEVLQSDSADLPMLFQQRQIDAAVVPEPWAARLESRHAAQVALTEAQMLNGATLPSAVLVATRRFSERRPEWTRAFLATHRALVREINADPAAMSARVNEALKRRTGKPLKPAVLREAWSRITITDEVSDPSLQEFAAMMRAVGYLRVPFDPAAFRLAAEGSEENAKSGGNEHKDTKTQRGSTKENTKGNEHSRSTDRSLAALCRSLGPSCLCVPFPSDFAFSFFRVFAFSNSRIVSLL
jgi:NitT/TauT family transport system substrate-binding protein